MLFSLTAEGCPISHNRDEVEKRDWAMAMGKWRGHSDLDA